MKVGCSSWTFDVPIRSTALSLPEFIGAAADLDLDSVELLDHHFTETNASYIQSLALAASNSGVEVACVAVSNKFGYPDPEIRDSGVERLKTFARIAIDLGARAIRVFTGDNGSSTEENMARKLWVVDALKRTAEIAEQLNIPFGIENHDVICRSADEILWLMDEVDSAFIGTCPDPLNWNPNGDDPELIYAETEKLAPFAVHAHVKVTNINKQGEDSRIDFGRLLHIFSDSEFIGCQSIEHRIQEPSKELPAIVEMVRRHIGALAND